MNIKTILGLVIVFGDLFIALYIISLIGFGNFSKFISFSFVSSFITAFILVFYYTQFAKFDRSSTSYWKQISLIKQNKISSVTIYMILLILMVNLILLVVFQEHSILIGLLTGFSLTSYLFFLGQEVLYKIEFMKETADDLVKVWIEKKNGNK